MVIGKAIGRARPHDQHFIGREWTRLSLSAARPMKPQRWIRQTCLCAPPTHQTPHDSNAAAVRRRRRNRSDLPNKPILLTCERRRDRIDAEVAVRPPLGSLPFVVAAGRRILTGLARQQIGEVFWVALVAGSGGASLIDIGTHLKSDEVVDFLETYELRVEYHFDRLREGEQDSYSVECEELSFELSFDPDQRCTTIFIANPDAVLESGLAQFPYLKSRAAVEEYAKAHSLELRRGPSWLRCDGPTRCLHYEFVGERLNRITLMSSEIAPE